MSSPERWPALPLAAWRETCDTLHMWTQIVGKVRMELSPHRNHWWSATLYVTPRGLTTGIIPNGGKPFELRFDFVDSQLRLEFGDRVATVTLAPRAVADFYEEFMALLRSNGVEVSINTMPQEFPDPIPFPQDRTHGAYDAEAVRRFHQILVGVDALLSEYQSGWLGKASPVHFFWGSFDLCVTRFDGKRAPAREGADCVTREAYSHACISAGWWPGGGPVEDAAFYAYAAPAPPGYGAPVRPEAAYFDPAWNEYLLMYEDVRKSPDPDQAVREFLQSTYELAANLAKWDRDALEFNPTSEAENPKWRVRPCVSTSKR